MNSTKFSNILVSEKVKIKHSVSVTCILMVSVILQLHIDICYMLCFNWYAWINRSRKTLQ